MCNNLMPGYDIKTAKCISPQSHILPQRVKLHKRKRLATIFLGTLYKNRKFLWSVDVFYQHIAYQTQIHRTLYANTPAPLLKQSKCRSIHFDQIRSVQDLFLLFYCYLDCFCITISGVYIDRCLTFFLSLNNALCIDRLY